jgi:archaemetzincin
LITSSDYRIILSPIGEIAPGLLDPIGREVFRFFGYPTEIIELLKDIEFAYDPERNQYHSTSILEKLSALAPERALRILAITRVDLFIPILTHVYGEAQLGGKSCIISTCRLKEALNPATAEDAFRFRVFKEAFHELGHTFKLRHCKDTSCIMHYCRSIKDVDRKSDQLCRYCNILLEDELKRFL